jgi:hypothetical protein
MIPGPTHVLHSNPKLGCKKLFSVVRLNSAVEVCSCKLVVVRVHTSVYRCDSLLTDKQAVQLALCLAPHMILSQCCFMADSPER